VTPVRTTISKIGGTTLNGAYMGCPFTTLSANRDALNLSCFGRNYFFPKVTIQSLCRHPGLFSVGLRIEHTDRSYPGLVIFWPYSFLRGAGFKKLRAQLKDLGYTVVD